MLTLMYRVQMPEDLNERIEQGRRTISDNPVLAAVLIGVGVITALVFFFGIFKQAFKAAIFGAVLSAAAWIWYFNYFDAG
jgi:hypothetical protein